MTKNEWTTEEVLQDITKQTESFKINYEKLIRENNILKKENERLKENIYSMLFTDDVVQKRYNKSLKENKKIKNLLKECRYKIIADLDDARLRESSVDIEDFEYLLDRINQALGEDK